MKTREFARAIERCEIEGARACVESARRIAPESGAELLDIAGGVAAFAGIDSPLSEATGLAMDAPVTASEIERLTRFYRSRETAAAVLVNPFADPSLPQRLADAGYRPAEYQSALAADLSAIEGRHDERIAPSADSGIWAEASARGFLDGAVPPPEFALVGRIVAEAAGVVALAGRNAGAVVATGAMDVAGAMAGLFASSVLPAFRRQGWQSALILDRVARAKAAGARYARAAAAPGSASEANFRRLGFQVLYTRTLWRWRPE